MPDEVLEALRERAAQRHLSLAAYAREVLVREAGRATMVETLAGPRVIAGRRLTARQLKNLTRAGRA
jgi:plasmid stability protein